MIRMLLLLLLSLTTTAATDGVSYSARDDVQNAHIEYEIDNECGDFVESTDRVQLCYSKDYAIYGCLLKSFTFREEPAKWHFISPADDDQLRAIIHSVDVHKLHRSQGTTCSMGSLEFDRKSFYFNNPLSDPTRSKLHATILGWIDHSIPPHDRVYVTTTIEGDLQPTRPVTVAELLKHPDLYNGKRVRISGFYHSEYEDSSLYDRNGDPLSLSLWVNGSSTFARDKDLHWTDDGRVIMEGCFMKGPAGELGGWPASLQRVTKVVSLDPPRTPPPPADQSSKR
jgi:hypothetical protein